VFALPERYELAISVSIGRDGEYEMPCPTMT